MEKKIFTIVVERDEDGVYVASVPELPRCHTQADSLDELQANIKEAIEAYLESMEAKELPSIKFVGIQTLDKGRIRKTFMKKIISSFFLDWISSKEILLAIH